MRILTALMVQVAIVGASGYAGGELIRFIDAHPSMEAVALVAHRSAGKSLSEVHPHLSGGDRLLRSFDPPSFGGVDLVFFALPHGASAEPAMLALEAGARVVDLGSDFRLDTHDRYVEAYGAQHPHPDQLGVWAYGIPELFGPDIAAARAVAAPGCYPTSAVLAIAPLLEAGLAEPSGIVVDAMSGVSGAGRGVSDALQFGAVDESVKAYKVLVHRHRPEMERALDVVGRGPTSVLFTPHLVPMQRGILSTVYLRSTEGASQAACEEAFDKAYASSTFVRRIDGSPETRWLVGSNNCLLSVHVDERTGTTVVLSAIDNLVKGAAGQAVQCANLMFGFDEAAGLPSTGWMP